MRQSLLAHIFIAFVLLGAALGPVGPGASSGVPRLQPQLAQIAAQAPEQTVRVIVQKSGQGAGLEALVARLGGRVTGDLHIINAFAAEMTAAGALRLAGTAGVRWVSLDARVERASSADAAIFTTWATMPGAQVANSFVDGAAMTDSAFGPSGSFGYGSNATGSFSGFEAEITPGFAIAKVEVVLQAYVLAKLAAAQDPILTVYAGGKSGKSLVLNHHAFDTYIGAGQVGTVYVDVTNTRNWQWADFDNELELVIDQGKFKSSQYIYYDAVGLRVTSTPGSDASGGVAPTALPKEAIDLSNLASLYDRVVRATDVWNEAPAYLQGQGMTVAVVDSGTVKNRDLGGRLIAKVNFNESYHSANDKFGHGTFVTWIIGGDGRHSDGQYMGVAPKTNLVSVRVSDDQGMAYESDVVSGLQWIYQNKNKYNIRVVNLSLNSSAAQSHHTSPLDAAVEVLWFNGIVVVASAGNNGTANLYPPANDPFVITVGATNDGGTLGLDDDSVASFSAYGTAENGAAKPDLVAPGTGTVAYLPEVNKLTMGEAHPGNTINGKYFRMSGTSVSAPIVAGAAALLLQDEPGLTADQVKYRLMATANRSWPGYDAARAGAGYVDVYAAVHGTTTESANTGLGVSRLLTTGPDGLTDASVSWSSVSWSSVSWSSVSWSSVSWSSVSWSSDYWDP